MRGGGGAGGAGGGWGDWWRVCDNISKTIHCIEMKFSRAEGMVNPNTRWSFVAMATNYDVIITKLSDFKNVKTNCRMIPQLILYYYWRSEPVGIKNKLKLIRHHISSPFHHKELWGIICKRTIRTYSTHAI